jgi:hypothetical protein
MQRPEVTSTGTSFPTCLWHYLLARLIYDHQGFVLIAIVLALLVWARSRR